MEFSCEQIGLSEQELQDRIVSGIIDRMLSKYVTIYDYDTGLESEDIENTELKKRLDASIKEHIDKEIDRVAHTYLEPVTADLIENFKLQETTSWGEKKGEEMSLTDYLAKRCELYMAEPVNFEGKTKKEKGAYSHDWKQSSTRMTYAIEKYLHYHMEQAMKKSLGNAHKILHDAIISTVSASLTEVVGKIKTKVEIK